MIVIPFFLEGHRKTTFAAGFWVLCALVICTPPRLIQLVLGCGELWKVTQTVGSHLYTSLEEDRRLRITMQMCSSKGFNGTVDVLRDCSELKTKKKSSDHLNELLKPYRTQLLIFILYPPSELKSERMTNTNFLLHRQQANHTLDK